MRFGPTSLRLLLVLLVTGSFATIRAQPTAPTAEQLATLRAYSERPHRAAAGTPLTVDPSSREEVRQFYRRIYHASEYATINWTGSYVTGTAGTTSAALKEATLLRLNFFRALVGVPPTVTLNSTFSAKAQQAAFMMSANNTLDHYPSTSWLFYTEEGAEAARNSNLALDDYGPDAITIYMNDWGSNNAAVGHRRWLIYPQTREIGTGDVPGNGILVPSGNATWVLDGAFESARPMTRTVAVAYPPAGFVPYPLVWPRWSFSHPDADFTMATVSMTRNGQPIAVSIETFTGRLGEPTLVWVYDGLDPNVNTTHTRPLADMTYTVTLKNVGIAGSRQTITYDVTVFDPDVAGPDYMPTSVSGSSAPTVDVPTSYIVAKPTFAGSSEWRSFALTSYAKHYDAEVGLDGITASVSPGYNVVQHNLTGEGAAAFHLVHPDWTGSQTLTVPDELYVASNTASVSFLSRLGWATEIQVGKVEISTDGGVSWSDIYRQAGITGQTEPSFQRRTASLAEFNGRTIQVRFNYAASRGGSRYLQTDAGTGWYIDDIAFTGVQRAMPNTVGSVDSGTAFSFTPSAPATVGLQARGVLFDAYPLEWGPVTLVSPTALSAPTFTMQPSSAAGAVGMKLTLHASVDGAATFSWQFNGRTIEGATASNLTLDNVASAMTGLYTATAAIGNARRTSSPAIVGMTTHHKVVGSAREIEPHDIAHANGNIFDQILLEGDAASFVADPGQITRMSFLDLNDDIVQIEFSGPGTASVVLEGATGPEAPVSYNQNVTYMKGHAGIVITGATEESNLTIFSVGRGTAGNQALFSNEMTYDGIADLAFVAIQSSNGKFGGLRGANASFWNTKGFTGVYAPGVEFNGPVYVHNIGAQHDATPVLILGSATGDTWITGGNLLQGNARAVRVSGLTRLQFKDGVTSHYVPAAPVTSEYLFAKTNQARLERDGVDVTADVVVNP